MQLVPRTLSLLAACAAMIGCGGGGSSGSAPPEEKWAVVTSEAAPLLGELEDDDPAQEVIRAGELVKIVREIRPFHWESRMDGAEAHREGMALEVRYAEQGVGLFAFKPDFAAELSVPTTAHLCGALAATGTFDTARCPALLRRAKTAGGALLVYMACGVGKCPVGLFHEGKLTSIPVESVSSAWFFAGKKRSMLVAQTRWTKDDGKQSGGALVPIVLDGAALERKDEIAVDRIDVRDPAKMLSRLVHARVTATEVTLSGEETVKSESGETLSTRAVDEKRPLPSLE